MEGAPQTINVYDPEGNPGTIPAEQLDAALQNGFRQATPEDINAEGHSGVGEQALGLAEEAGRSGTFGVSTGLERGLSELGVPNLSPEDISGREHYLSENHPVLKGAASLAGLGASSLIPVVGEANVLGAAGEAGAKAIGLGLEGAGTLSKIGSAAVKGGIETALFQSGDEVHKMLSNQMDPDHPVQTALLDVGLSGLIGTGVGGAIGSVSPLWKATAGPKLSRFMEALKNHMGGIEGQTSDAVNDALTVSGIETTPAMRSILSESEMAQQHYKDLRQSPSPSGLEVAKTADQFRSNIGKGIAEVSGKTPEEIGALSDISPNKMGAELANTISKEFETQVAPLAEEFEALKTKKAPVELVQDQVVTDPLNPYQTKTIPGITTQAADEVAKIASEFPLDSDASKMASQLITKLPRLKTIGDLTQEATRLQEAYYNPLNPPLNRQVQQLVGVLRDAEANATMRSLQEEAPDLIGRHQEARAAWKQVSDLKDDLQSKLNLKGGNRNSNQAFVKNLRSYAEENAEKFLKKITNPNDAYLSKILEEKFPATAQAVKQYHLDQMLAKAADKAAPGQVLNPTSFFNQMKNLSPELKSSIFSPEALQQLEAHKTLWDSLNALDKDRNFSNTAPTLMRYLKNLPGTAVGFITAAMEHNPVLGAIFGGLTNTIGRDAPDAIKLGLLKFMGSSQPMDSEALKASIDWIHSIQKGEKALTKASKAVFEYGTPVITKEVLDQSQRDKLSKRIESLSGDPSPLMNIGGKIPHYLPDHGESMAKTAANAVNILNQARPKPQKLSPLDSELPPSKAEQSAYNRLLTIAQRPLTVLDHVKNGTLTPEDVKSFHDLYPALYQRVSGKLLEEMANRVEGEKPIPYTTRMGLSLFLGQPMDSTLTPQSIMATQASFSKMTPSEAPQQAARQKHSMKALDKMSSNLQTPLQAREKEKMLF